MKILLIADHTHQTLKSSTLHVLTAAQEIGSPIDVAVIGYQCENAVQEATHLAGVTTVFHVDAKEYAHQLAENVAELIKMLAIGYDYILMSDSSDGKNILPRVAALLDVAMISDVIRVMSPDTFVRPIYAGNALSTVQSSDSIKLLTIRSTAFAASELMDRSVAQIQKVETVIANTLTEFVSDEIHTSARPTLGAAKIVIAGGRGLKSAENFKLLEQLADKLGAAIGASRAAVDAGFAPNDYQVGQTGKVVAPDLYIAIGISGAIQHIAGMKDSKVIVAINNDPDAPIFQIADYGLVADLFTALNELETEFK